MANFTVFPSTVSAFTLKSTPIVADWPGLNLSSVNLNRRLKNKLKFRNVIDIIYFLLKKLYSHWYCVKKVAVFMKITLMEMLK